MDSGNELTERIRCPIHGFIRYSKNERNIIDHWTFQRLRNIKQLALAYYVYPGAMHTRFEHSLGVMELCTQVFDTLMLNRDYEKLVKDSLMELPDFKHDTIRKARQMLRLLGLVHDIGHAPFSHACELMAPDRNHEKVSQYVVMNLLKNEINSILKYDNGAEDLSLIMDKTRIMDKPQLLFIQKLFSSQIDFDRTDYLIRDSYHCGVEYGRFDYRRLIQTLGLCINQDGQLETCIDIGGLQTVESLIIARYMITSQVYYHRIRRIYDKYLENYIISKNLNNQSEKTVLGYDDVIMTAEIKKDEKSSEDNFRKWASYINTRKPHKTILEEVNADAKIDDSMKKVFYKLNLEYPESNLIYDYDNPPIHKFHVKGDDKMGDDLIVIDKQDIKHSLTNKSLIIANIPKYFGIARIFADCKEDKVLRKEITLEATKEYNKILEGVR